MVCGAPRSARRLRFTTRKPDNGMAATIALMTTSRSTLSLVASRHSDRKPTPGRRAKNTLSELDVHTDNKHSHNIGTCYMSEKVDGA